MRDEMRFQTRRRLSSPAPPVDRCAVESDFTPKDIFLHPGEYAFGDSQTRIRTLLGSCVAITFWHPELRIGAMCHYLLPARPPSKIGLVGNYANEVISAIAAHFHNQNLTSSEFQVKMFGGSNMFPDLSLDEILSVGSKNIYMGEKILTELGFRITTSDLAGVTQRMVIFELWSGDVWVRQGFRRGEDGETSLLEPFKPRTRPS
jgi:chemotaxis protein CheD